jgi:hypothetical protein
VPDSAFSRLPEAATAGSGEVAADPGRARAVLEQLGLLLEMDDTSAGDLFEDNRPLLLATLGARAMQLGRRMSDYDYPGALETVRDLIRQAPQD